MPLLLLLRADHVQFRSLNMSHALMEQLELYTCFSNALMNVMYLLFIPPPLPMISLVSFLLVPKKILAVPESQW